MTMIFQSELSTIDTELSQLQALLDAKRQQRSLFEELDAETNAAIEMVALLKTKIEAVSCDAIASLKTAVLTLFDDGDDGSDGGNQPHSPTPDPDDSEFELLCLNGETGDCLTTDDLTDADIEADTSIKLTYSQAIKNRCSACWGYEVKSKTDIKAGFVNRANLNFMEAVNLERTGKEFYQTVEAYLDRLYYNGQTCEWASPLASPLCSLVWEDAPLLGQACAWASLFASPLACAVEFPQPDSQKPAYTEFVGVSDRVGYIKLNTTGEIIATYAGFNNKARAKSWANYLETMTSRIELRAAKRLGDWKHELKMSGLSIKQIERLSTENLDKMPPDKEPSLPPTYKPQLIPQPVNPDEVGKDDIVTALLTPSASYKIIQVMPNGILDCENLTTGDRLGLRPGAVSLVQKAEKSQDPEQQALDLDPKPDAPKKYARVKLKGDRFDGQVLSVVKGNELGATLATPDGHYWFRSDCLQIIDPDAQTTTGNYKGLSKQMRQHWEKVGINPSDLIADMKANRPPEPEWNAAKYNPVLAAVGADDASDF
jgi:hypothetical protein